MVSKKELSERDICTQCILPALVKAGWNVETQIREEVFFTDGRIYVKGNKTARGKRKRADFILYYRPNIPVAVIEAKDNRHTLGAGMQQALGYASILDIPVAFSSNGVGWKGGILKQPTPKSSLMGLSAILAAQSRVFNADICQPQYFSK